MQEAVQPQKGGQHVLGRWIDHRETYGPHVITDFCQGLTGLPTVVDLGAGGGRDLALVKAQHPQVKTIAIEASADYAAGLQGKVDEIHISSIERDVLPFADNSLDLVIANQILEHTKEIFWIFHEVTRCLKPGGRFLIGVPNIASFHNRLLLLLLGRQPTQHKLCSAHVRPFSKRDTLKFTEQCFPGGYHLERFAGAQFYPFPKPAARFLSRVFPTAAFSIFFLLQKQKAYTDGFITYPVKAQLETNFWLGEQGSGTAYYSGGSAGEGHSRDAA